MYAGVIKKIDAHAVANYDKGWDGWLETMSDDDKLEVFGGAKDYDTCFHRAVIQVAFLADMDEARAETCALYDVNPDFMEKLTTNRERMKKEAEKSKAALKELEEQQDYEEGLAEDAAEDPERFIRYKYSL